MIEATGFDMSGLEFAFRGLHNALLGTGQQGAMRQFLKNEVRQLAMEISDQMGPESLQAGAAKIEKDLKKLFHPMVNSKTGADWNIFFGPKAGLSDTRWLYAGPTFLVGVKQTDYFPQGSATALEQIYNEQGRAKVSRGNAWQDQGQKIEVAGKKKYQASRGKQHVMMLNRIAVRKSQFNELLGRLTKRVGRLKAKFASTARKLGQNRIPGWVSKHFSKVEQDGTAIFNATELASPDAPAIIFGAIAPGLDSNPYVRKKIQGAVKRREQITIVKMRRILSGFAYNFNTGAVYKPKLED